MGLENALQEAVLHLTERLYFSLPIWPLIGAW